MDDFETPRPPEPPDEPIEPDRPNRGRARARYEKRKHVQQAKPAGSPRQLRPPQQFTMPNVTIPGGSRVLIGIVGAVVFVVLIVVVLGRLRNDAPEVEPNAVWLGTEWTYEQPTDEQVAGLVERLREQKIGTIYAWVSWYQFDGTWRGTDQFENVKTFVQQFDAAYPEAKLYGWVSVPVQDETGAERADYTTLPQPVADFSKRVMDEFGFDGVFLNVEQVWDGDENFLSLLRAVRATVGIDTPISAAIPPDWSPSNSSIPLPPLIEPGTEWAKDYKQSVALLVDQMAVMAYNSGLSTPTDYAQWVAYQVKSYAQIIADLNTDTEILVGIPTYGAALPGHDPNVENVSSAVDGVKQGLQAAGSASSHVQGLAIYSEWETDDAEWAAFKADWLNEQ